MAFKIGKSSCVFLLLLAAAVCPEETCIFPKYETKTEEFERLTKAALDAIKLLYDDASKFCPAVENLTDQTKKELEDTKGSWEGEVVHLCIIGR